MDNFKLLPDQPLRSQADFENAKFGHNEIAETLTSLIINCPTPFTIGLFGRWGVGKSTISYMLKKAMAENKFGFVVFDVWKHESDALRRTFLKESVRQLKDQNNLQNDFTLEERLDSKVTRKIEGQFRLKDFIKKYRNVGLSIFIGIVLLGILVYWFLGVESLKTFASIILSIFAGGGVASAIISKAMSYFLTSETITQEIERFKDPHEFEFEFERLVENLRPNKMLVIFDNLDRITHEKAVEILSTIKTFLETENVKGKGVIFLIPCDDRAIKEHLRNVYYRLSDVEKDAFSGEEFLRKFFNATLRIPDFYPTELESYAMNLLNETSIPEFKESSVAWLVTKAYRQSPRQIKQFINQLIGLYILARKRIEKSSLPSDFLTGNISKLAKFLILYNRFPEQMEELRRRKIWDLEKALLEKEIVGDPNFVEFNNFLNETNHIPISNLNIFFMLRRSEFEIQLPGYDDFATALQDNRADDVTSYLQALTEFHTKRGVLSQAIKKLLEETTLPDTRISIINSCLTGLNKINERLEDMVYVEIVYELTDLKQYLYVIEPKVIFDQILKHYPQNRDEFAKTYVELLAQEKSGTKLPIKFVEDLLVEITNNIEWFGKHTDKLSNIVEEKYHDQPRIIRILLINEQTQKTFAIEKILKKTVTTLSKADLEGGKSFEEKIDLLTLVIPDAFNKQLVDATLAQITQLITDENTKPLDSSRIAIKKRLSNGITLILKRHEVSFREKGDQAGKDQLCQAIINGINQIGDWGQRGIYVEPLNQISTIKPSNVSQAISIVKDFIVNAPFEKLLDGFKDKDRDKKEWQVLLFDNNYAEYFKQRSLKEQKIFDYFYEFLTEIQKKDWLITLLDVDPSRGIQKIESLESNIPDTGNVLRKLLGISKKIEITNRFKVYEICDKLKFANDDTLLQQACTDAKSYLTVVDEPNQKLGYDLSTGLASFSEMHRREIARNTVDWLISLQPGQVYQPFGIRTVMKLWNVLSGEPLIQSKFVEYIFSLLLKATTIDSIKLGLEILKTAKPDFTIYSSYYNDLKHRTDNEQNSQIKEILLQGFKELKIALDVHSLGWWDWIEPREEKNKEG